jgi:integrase
VPKLTKRVVEMAPVHPSDYFIWCDELPGFGVRIYPSGKRSYLVQYRAEGRSRRAKLGLHGHLTCEQARKEAMALLGQVARGQDPAEERATRREAITVRELCEQYKVAVQRGLIMGKKGLPKKPLTMLSDTGRIDRHIVPVLGNRRVRDLTTADITRFMRDVMAGKTAMVQKTDKLRGKSVVRGGRGAATRTVGLLGGILTYAVSEGIISQSPAAGVRRPASEIRTARLVPADYAALGAALNAATAAGVAPTAVTAVKLLALTGCRKGEILGLRWTEADDGARVFRLADSKEGASIRPIGRSAFAILSQLDRTDGSGLVLPGRRPDTSFGGLKGAWNKLMQRAGLSSVTPHTLRHSFASVAGDLGYSEATIAALLGHAAGTVTGRYTHIMDNVLIAAADRVADTIARYMDEVQLPLRDVEGRLGPQAEAA